MKIKGILFDKDGTLFDFNKTWGGWFERLLGDLAPGDTALKHHLAAACGYNFDTGQFAVGSIGVTGTALEVNEALANILPDTTAAQVDVLALKHLEHLPNVPVCNLPALMTELRGLGMVLGVATNDYAAGAEYQLAHAEIRDQFAFVCGSDSGFGGKPDIGMITAFCEETGLRPDQIIMVGDSVHDLQTGRNAQVAYTIGVLTGPAKAADLQSLADIILHDISKLPGFLRENGLTPEND